MHDNAVLRCGHCSDTAREANGGNGHVTFPPCLTPLSVTSSAASLEPKMECSTSSVFSLATNHDARLAEGIPAENLLVRIDSCTEQQDATEVLVLVKSAKEPPSNQTSMPQQFARNEGSFSEQHHVSYSSANEQAVAAKRTKYCHQPGLDHSLPPSGTQAANSSGFSPPDNTPSIDTPHDVLVLSQILQVVQRLERKLDDVQRVQAQQQATIITQQATITTLVQQNDRILGYTSSTNHLLSQQTNVDSGNANASLHARQLPCLASSIQSHATSLPYSHNQVRCVGSPFVQSGDSITSWENSGFMLSDTQGKLANIEPSEASSSFASSSASTSYICSTSAQSSSSSSHAACTGSSSDFKPFHSDPTTTSSSILPVESHYPQDSAVVSGSGRVGPKPRYPKVRYGATLIRDSRDGRVGYLGGDPNVIIDTNTYMSLFNKEGSTPMRLLLALLCLLYGEERLSSMSYAGRDKRPCLKGQPEFNAAVAQIRQQFPGFQMTPGEVAGLSDKICKLRSRLAKANTARDGLEENATVGDDQTE